MIISRNASITLAKGEHTWTTLTTKKSENGRVASTRTRVQRVRRWEKRPGPEFKACETIEKVKLLKR